MMKKYVTNAEIIKQNLAKQKDIQESATPKRYTSPTSHMSEAANLMLENKAIMHKNMESFREFKQEVPNTLMEYAIGVVFDQVLSESMAEDYEYEIGYNIIRNFINEEGYNNLINRFAKKNLLLSEMARYCEIYKEMIIDEASEGIKKSIKNDDGDDLCYTMNSDLASDFVEKIKDMVPNRTIAIIRSRVADSMEDFVNQNAENKAAIVDIYTKANAATQDPGLSESVEMDLKRLAKNEASKIYDKPTNVLGAIVRSLTESIMKDKDIRQQYMTEDNHINMERIVNESTIIYTVLEELNSLQMVDVDEKYIKNMINSIS